MFERAALNLSEGESPEAYLSVAKSIMKGLARV
jgi:hypothetical protein